MSQCSILLIENDPGLLEMLTLILEQEGYRVSHYTCAEHALRIESESPDIAILDYRLPGMDGLALLEQLRFRSPTLPALIISSECRPESLPCGAPSTRLLRKPFVYATFMASVADLLNSGVRP